MPSKRRGRGQRARNSADPAVPVGASRGFVMMTVRGREHSAAREILEALSSLTQAAPESRKRRRLEDMVREEHAELSHQFKPVFCGLECVVYLIPATQNAPRPLPLAASLFARLREKDLTTPVPNDVHVLTPMSFFCEISADSACELTACLQRELSRLNVLTNECAPTTFAIRLSRRAPKTSRARLLQAAASAVACEKHTVDLTDPDVLMLIDVTDKLCGGCVVDARTYEQCGRFSIDRALSADSAP